MIIKNIRVYGTDEQFHEGSVCISGERFVSSEAAKDSAAAEQNSGGSDESRDSNSTGVALANVISRLELYYGKKNLFSIWSDGPMCGTEVSVLLPLEREDTAAEQGDDTAEVLLTEDEEEL